MNTISRRSLIAGTGAAAAAVALDPLASIPAARASAPPVAKQGPGFYRAKHGDFEITQISDGAATFPKDSVRELALADRAHGNQARWRSRP
jgi:hypothetical protein